MDWLVIVGPAAAAAGVAGAVVWGLVYRKGNQVWASKADVEKLATNAVTRTELDGLGTRVSDLAEQVTGAAQLADENHDKISLMERDLEHRSEIMGASVVIPLQQIADRLEAMQKTQSEMAMTQATHTSDMKALGRGFDELKERFNRIEDR